MGIDKGRVRHRNTRTAVCDNEYQRMLIKAYEHLARRTESDFNRRVHHRLLLSRENRHPLSIESINKFMTVHEGKTAVVVGTVTNDERMLVVPKMRVAALRFTETARARIEKVGGECLTLDQLALDAPKGNNCVLLRGKMSSREAQKHFGIPGQKHSHVKPYGKNKGRNHRDKNTQH